jgi:hypothetical protein
VSAKLLGLALAAPMPSQTAKLVLIGLCDAAEGDGSSAYPSVARLSAAAQCTDRAVQKWLKIFRETAFRGGRRLIAVVRPGGSGPGSMTEYQIDVELLVELERKGWDGLAEEPPGVDQVDQADAGKGESGSPLGKGEPDAAKGESAAAKGEQIDSPDPSLDPSTRSGESAGARAGQEKPEASPATPAGRPTPEEALEQLRKSWPNYALESQGLALSALSRLVASERQVAIDRVPAFLVFHRENRGARALPYLHTYLAERRWADLPDRPKAAAGAAGATGHAAAFSRAWWAIFHRFVAASPGAFADRDSAQSQTLRKRVSLAIGNAIGWTLPAEQLARIEAEAEGLVKAPAHGDVAERWRAHYRELGVTMPIPDQAGWIFVPAELPPAATADGG